MTAIKIAAALLAGVVAALAVGVPLYLLGAPVLAGWFSVLLGFSASMRAARVMFP